MAKEIKPIPVGPQSATVGEVNPDFAAQGLKDWYDPSPPKLPSHVIGPPGVKHIIRPAPQVTGVGPGGVRKMKWALVGTKPYKWAMSRTVTLVAAAAALRLDTGRGNRIDLVLQNIGDNPVWFDFTREVVATRSKFIAGSPIVGAYLGGVWAASLGEEIEVWAIADPAGNTNVVVTEYGY